MSPPAAADMSSGQQSERSSDSAPALALPSLSADPPSASLGSGPLPVALLLPRAASAALDAAGARADDPASPVLVAELFDSAASGDSGGAPRARPPTPRELRMSIDSARSEVAAAQLVPALMEAEGGEPCARVIGRAALSDPVAAVTPWVPVPVHSASAPARAAQMADPLRLPSVRTSLPQNETAANDPATPAVQEPQGGARRMDEAAAAAVAADAGSSGELGDPPAFGFTAAALSGRPSGPLALDPDVGPSPRRLWNPRAPVAAPESPLTPPPPPDAVPEAPPAPRSPPTRPASLQRLSRPAPQRQTSRTLPNATLSTLSESSSSSSHNTNESISSGSSSDRATVYYSQGALAEASQLATLPEATALRDDADSSYETAGEEPFAEPADDAERARAQGA